MADIDTIGARELELWINNDSDLYRQMHTPINKNLINKMAAGVFNKNLALKAFMNLADEGARRYNKAFGDGLTLKGFSVATRKAVAQSLLESFIDEAELGNFDDLLYKKYRR